MARFSLRTKPRTFADAGLILNSQTRGKCSGLCCWENTMAKRQYNEWRRRGDGAIEIELTQGKTALIDECDADRVLKYKWFAWRCGRTLYAATGITIAPYKVKSFRLHRFVLDIAKNTDIHFRNGNTLDCRRSNLQLYNKDEIIPKKRNNWRRLEDGTIEVELTQGQTALIDTQDLEKILAYKWCAHAEHNDCWYTYAAGPRGDKGRPVVRMHRIILNAPDGMQVDHRNGNGLDNRRANLRLATASQNLANSRKRRGCRHRYKGVSTQKNTRRWRACISANGCTIHLGYFDTEAEAAQAYNVAALHHFGEFARLNEIAG